MGEKAVAYHREGYNCAQVVLLTLYDYMYPNAKNDAIPKIATGMAKAKQADVFETSAPNSSNR